MKLGIIIIVVLIAILITYLILKPYFIKYDTTILFTGGLGSGKTLTAVKKTGLKIYKKTLFDIKFKNKIRKQINKLINHHNNRKHVKKEWHELDIQELPRLISNIPIRISKRKNLWSTKLTKEMLTLEEYIPEYSVVIIDEISQLVNQFNWNIEKVQHNLNEFIQLFRHYIAGKLIMTAQADSEVVKQIRCKMNQYYELFDFHKMFFGLFYKTRIVQYSASEMVQNVNMSFVEENMRWQYGCLKPRVYDSRCYSERYQKLKEKQKKREDHKYKRFYKFKTNDIIRFDNYESPLDDKKENK